MSGVGIGIAVTWAVLLAIWLVRLPSDQLYRPTIGLLSWLSIRVLLRLGVGVFGGMWYESLHAPRESPFAVMIVQSSCGAAWEQGEPAFQVFHAQGVRVGLLVAKPHEAYWAIPPTQDSAVWFTLWRALRAVVPESPQIAASAPVLAQLRPHREQLTEALWIGSFDSLPTSAKEWSHWIPACRTALRQEDWPSYPSLSGFSPSRPPFSEAQVYGLLVLGCGLALLALEVGLYVFRYHLPFRTAQELIR